MVICEFYRISYGSVKVGYGRKSNLYWGDNSLELRRLVQNFAIVKGKLEH